MDDSSLPDQAFCSENVNCISISTSDTEPHLEGYVVFFHIHYGTFHQIVGCNSIRLSCTSSLVVSSVMLNLMERLDPIRLLQPTNQAAMAQVFFDTVQCLQHGSDGTLPFLIRHRADFRHFSLLHRTLPFWKR